MSSRILQARDRARERGLVTSRGWAVEENATRQTEEVSRWFNINKNENRWRLKGDLSWPSWERVWAAGFCRYSTKDSAAGGGYDDKVRKLREALDCC